MDILFNVEKRSKGNFWRKALKVPLITSILKAYNSDTKSRAAFYGADNLTSTSHFWLVRQCIIISSYFGSLKFVEAASLQLETVNIKKHDVYITHSRAKQRSDKMVTRWVMQRDGSGEIMLRL